MYIYGTDYQEIKKLIEEDQELGEKLHPKLDYLKAEVVWAVRNEMARTIEDVLARRVRVLFLDARAAVEMAPVVADILAKELDKTIEWKTSQISAFKSLAKNYIIQSQPTT